MTEVGDHQSLVASLKQAAYFHLFKDEAGVWERRLAVLSEGLQSLNAIQRKWVYLEPIFARGALPNEQPRFRRIDDQFRQLLSGTEADPMVVHFADIPRIMETLQQMLQQMEICQKALSNFLEDKRSVFPRFYFIGDDDLLEILGQARDPAAELKQQLAEYTAADWEGYRVMQLKIQALVLDLIHHIDVVEALISERVSSSDDWGWVKQLRYYRTGRTGATALVVKMAGAALDYSWEYQGNAPKLVYTPLTDRCYLTLTQGITLGYGGNPYGPAGTGKTESVKALGQALARQVLVFNCDGEFDFKSVGRIFMGLVKCGAWGCFDEFNRLEEDVLSAVSQQIQLIQGAIKARQPSVELMGRSIDVNCNAGIFVTMNPAGKGYGGRSKLPDNLKALFRSVAMTLPDNEIIAEVLLLSNGFASAKELGRKLVALFGLAQQLLSRQQHYDWGLRALKICLAIAGRLLRKHRFQALLQDIFSGVSMPETADDQMLAAIHSSAASLHLQVVPEQVEKVLQLHLACLQRIGVIIVGPSGSGKSTIWRLLQAALTSLGRPPVLHALNPKAISRHHLLGHIDADTREWTDGVLTAAARAVAKEPLEQRSWVVCDGANLDEVGRQRLAAEISKLTGEPNVLLGASQGDIAALLRGVEGPSSFLDTPDPHPSGQLIMTEGVSNVILGLVPWLRTQAPLLLVGPEGCGKATLLQHCLDQLAGTAVATVSCSAQTTAANLIQKLEQMCGTPVSTSTGRVLRPRDSGKLVLYLRDINLPKADKYGTSQVMAFLQQLLTYQGFYDSKLEFVGLERIQIVGSMNPATTVGRQPLAPRFAALMHVVGLDPSWNGQGTADKLAACLLEVYTALQSAFSPSQHPHYNFTPRHLSLWASGLQSYSLHATDLLQAAAYEACRVFRDRLVSSEHTLRFDSILAETLRKHWRVNLDLTGSIFATLGGPAAQLTAGKGSAGAAQALLNHWSSSDYLQLVTEKVTAFEREQRELSMVLFGQALERLAQLDRVVSKPGGAALICGQAGVGRKSALALVAYMHHMEVFCPSMPRGYNLQSFRNDLKALMLKTGIEGQPACLFLEDHQMVDPGFLECINSLLSGGEVHGLFTNEELDSTLAPLKEVVASQALLGQTLFSFFTAQVQRNLRIVISMDPSSPDFQHRCQANPALFSRCNILWMEGWDEDGMQAVATARLQPILHDAEKDATGTSKLVQQAMVLHSSCLATGATPRHYVAFVSLCSSIYTKKRSQLLQQQNFLKGGLSKLAGAAATVDTLSKEAQQQRVQLKASQVQAEQALQNITAAMEQASGHRQEAALLKKQLADDQVSINGRKGNVESELAVVAPIIEAARLAVGQIKSDHLNEIRSLKAPPDAIRDVLEGVLKLMGQADTSWNSMKKFLGNRGIKNEIIEYDAHRITPEMRTAVNRLLAQKGASFEQATIFRVSQAAAPLAAWVTANLQYADVLQKVAPLEQELGGLTANYTQSQERIAGCEAQLQQLDEQVVSLKGEFESKKGLEIELKNSLAKAKATLTAASSLLGKLSDVKMAVPWSLIRFLASESEQLTWKTQGLAHDTLSAENAVVILQFVTTLELAVRFGKTLVVEEADSIEPLMYPLLTGDMQGQGSSSSVKIGDRIVDYNKDFRLMLVTRNSRPQLAVAAAALLCLVNFTVTRSGLEGLLLGLALHTEQPQLESQRTALLQQEEEQRLQLAALDTQVLQSLATSKGSLLDNQELLESLNQAKAKAATINASLQESCNLQ
ncbi:hypothetical protein WJX79_009392, partial [Trebouxia sp. C0005]